MAKTPPGNAQRRLSPRSPAAAAMRPHQEGMGTKEEGISNKGGGRTLFDGWLLGVVSLSTRSGCAAHRGGRRQRRRTRTTAAASSLPGASPFSFCRHRGRAATGRTEGGGVKGGRGARRRQASQPASQPAGVQAGCQGSGAQAHSCQGCSPTPASGSPAPHP